MLDWSVESLILPVPGINGYVVTGWFTVKTKIYWQRTDWKRKTKNQIHGNQVIKLRKTIYSCSNILNNIWFIYSDLSNSITFSQYFINKSSHTMKRHLIAKEYLVHELVALDEHCELVSVSVVAVSSDLVTMDQSNRLVLMVLR